MGSHSSLTGELERTQRSEELAVGLLFYVADVQPVYLETYYEDGLNLLIRITPNIGKNCPCLPAMYTLSTSVSSTGSSSSCRASSLRCSSCGPRWWPRDRRKSSRENSTRSL